MLPEQAERLATRAMMRIMKLPWKRTRGHSFDEFGRAITADCRRKLEDMCRARGYTLERIPSLLLGPLVASIRSYVKNGGREHMRTLAKKRAGYARQRQERERIAANPLYKPCWQLAAEQRSLNAKHRREKREEEQQRRELGLPPKSRSNYTFYDDPWPRSVS
jgi:hypothetical protein